MNPRRHAYRWGSCAATLLGMASLSSCQATYSAGVTYDSAGSFTLYMNCPVSAPVTVEVGNFTDRLEPVWSATLPPGRTSPRKIKIGEVASPWTTSGDFPKLRDGADYYFRMRYGDGRDISILVEGRRRPQQGYIDTHDGAIVPLDEFLDASPQC